MPPNVLLVVMDTARADHVRETVDHRATMPTVGALADRGTEFRNATANAPWTLPSHATLFTGVPPSVHSAHAGHKRFSYGPTLAELLSEAGYRTVGISNNTWVSGEFGFARGFDEFLCTWQLFQDAVDFGEVARTRTGAVDRLRGVISKFRGNPFKNLANLAYGRFGRKRHDDGARRTNALVEDRIDEWADDDRPLFLFCNYLEPHLEYRPPARVAREWLPADVSLAEADAVNQDAWAYVTGETGMDDDDFEILQALYRAELAYLDERIGDLLDAFETAGMLRDTVVVVTGDHGEHIGEHDLMDHQYALTPELLSVPLVVAGPGFTDGRVETPVQLADLVPTLLETAGVEDAGVEFDAFGEGRPRSLSNPAGLPTDRPLFAEYLAPQPPLESLRDRYRCSRDISRYDRRLRAVRRGERLCVRGSDGSTSLFPVGDDADPAAAGAGSPDLSGTEPERTDELAAVLENWAATLPSPTDADVSIDAATRDRLEDMGYLQ